MPEKYVAKNRRLNMAPRKSGLVADAIRGKKASLALHFLKFNNKRASSELYSLLQSAVANAANKDQVNIEDLYVSDIKVGPGKTIKSGRVGSRATFKPIKRRFSNITIELEAKQAPTAKPEKEGNNE